MISGIATGYKRGFAAIVDANVVTFMTAFILFALATAEVKGFAFTLGIGTLLSLFTAVLATRAALGVMGRSKFVSHPSMLGAARRGRGWTFDFMGASKWFFSLSGTILLIGALAIGGKGLNFGIDFKSGTRIQTALVRPASENEVDRGAQVGRHRRRRGPEDHATRTSAATASRSRPRRSRRTPSNTRNRRSTRSSGTAKSPGTKNFSSTSIGPTFGKTVAKSALIAIIASLLVISAYIALRFEWKYAVPVLIALMHDLLITAGVYSLTGREVTSATVAALLTILGYSLYDTIIVFDRVRENVPRMPRAAFSQIVNRSMSEVLTRSLATSFCTLLPVTRAAAVRRRNAEGLRVRADDRDRLGCVLLDLHRLAGADALEGARAVYRVRRARIVRELRRGARRTRRPRRGAPEDVEPEVKKRRDAQRQPDLAGAARPADLQGRVPGTGPRHRRRRLDRRERRGQAPRRRRWRAALARRAARP